MKPMDDKTKAAFERFFGKLKFDPLPADTVWTEWEREELFFIEKMTVAQCAPEILKDELRRQGWTDTGRIAPQ